MSWAANGTYRDGKMDLQEYPQGGYGEEESKRAISAATKIAQDLIKTGVVGDGPYNVNLGGHANPNHSAEGFWAPDTITISVSRKTDG